jgi:three-Cys-motif partner protein
MSAMHAKHFSRFEPHTTLKHACLGNYLAAWVAKISLNSKGPKHTTLALVDAFAGEGSDDEGRPGSPLIMIDVANRMRAKLTQYREPPRLEITLFERSKSRCGKLQQNVEAYKPEQRAGVKVVPGTLKDHAAELLQRYAETPMLVFLDPFGVVGLDLDLVKRALSGRQHEVLIQFNSAAAERLAHVASKKETKAEARLRGPEAQGSLFGDELVAKPPPEITVSRTALERTQRKVRAHLRAIYGAEDWDTLEAKLVSELGEDVTPVDVYADLLGRAGAKYVTQLPVFNDRGGLQYVLLHATKSAAGRQTIKEAFCSAVRSSDLPDRVKDATFLWVRISDSTLTAALQTVGGKTVPWALGKADSLQKHLLRESEVFPSQMNEIKVALRAAGWKAPGRTEEFNIPTRLPQLRLRPPATYARAGRGSG